LNDYLRRTINRDRDCLFRISNLLNERFGITLKFGD